MLQQTTGKIWCLYLLYFPSDFKLKYWSGTSTLLLLLGHVNYMIFLNILTAYKKISCVFPLLEIFTECLFSKLQRKTTVFNQIIPSDHASRKPSILTKAVIVKFKIFCFGIFLLYNRQKRDTGNKLDTDQRYTETKFSRKIIMLDNI